MKHRQDYEIGEKYNWPNLDVQHYVKSKVFFTFLESWAGIRTIDIQRQHNVTLVSESFSVESRLYLIWDLVVWCPNARRRFIWVLELASVRYGTVLQRSKARLSCILKPVGVGSRCRGAQCRVASRGSSLHFVLNFVSASWRYVSG